MSGHDAESRELTALAAGTASPVELGDGVALLRRWTALPKSCKPHARVVWHGVGRDSAIGFLDWATAGLGVRAYAAFKAGHPDEAAAFRAQVLTLCAHAAESLEQVRGASPAPQFARVHAGHARELPARIFGADASG